MPGDFRRLSTSTRCALIALGGAGPPPAQPVPVNSQLSRGSSPLPAGPRQPFWMSSSAGSPRPAGELGLQGAPVDLGSQGRQYGVEPEADAEEEQELPRQPELA